ncbi:MAG TPA: hypothetical protein VHO28_14155, partial [Ignavibacteriales bacterium]|nr:hypothetical protein [Ignavibacteriales bacterium]
MSGALFSDSGRNIYAGRIGIGGDPDFTDYVFKTYGNGYFTGNLFVNGPARVERLGLGTDADASLSLKTAAGAYINGNLTVVGNIYQSGTAYLVDAQHLEVESNIIYVNKNEAGNGVTNGFAGIEVERGTGTNYQFMFQESDDTFRLGMAGALQAAATRQDSPIANGVAYWNNTVYRFDTSSNLKFDGTHLSIGEAALTEALNVRGNILQDINYKLSSRGYFSGWGNTGFELNTDASGVSNLIVDNLTVRRTMSVYEILIRQIRATNGNLFVSASGKISKLRGNETNGNYYITVEDVTGHGVIPFKKNDLFLIQKVRLDGGANLKYIIGRLHATYTDVPPSGYPLTPMEFVVKIWNGTTEVDGDAHITDKLEIGDTIVRVGNTTDLTRQGSIYLASDDDGAPFIDVRDGVNSYNAWGSAATKARLGNMAGIAGNPWGNQNIYGLYADVAWLTDNVVIGGRSLGLMQGMTALFHFDDNLRDSISGINASYTGTLNETSFGLIYTSDNSLVVTKVNGKFGGGAAVESGTTNLISNGGFEAGGSTGYSWWGSGTRSIVNGYHGNGYYMESTSSAVGLSSSAIAAVSGTTYTIQVKVKGDHLNYFYILKASGNVNISALATKTYLEGGWYQLTYTVTCTTTETWNILFAFYNYAKGIIDEAQVEARATATTFCESSRPIGKLVYPLSLINKNKFTIKGYFTMNATSFYVPIVALDNPSQGSATDRILLSVYNSQYLNLFVGNTSKASAFIPTLGRTYHFSLKFDGTTYTVKIDNNVVITHAAPVQSLASAQLELGCWMHNNLTYYTLNGWLDEIAIFNRDTTDDEDARIFYSNQPLQESPGMTYISGNKIRTGYIYSENYVKDKYGTMFDLNKGILEMNFGEKNIFKFDAAAATANIAGWGFTFDRLSKISGDKAVYIVSSETDLLGLQIDLKYGDHAAAGRAKWISVGRIRYGASDVISSNYGIAITADDGKPFFESSVSTAGVATNIIAGWNFDSSMLWNGNIRLEASASLKGLAIKNGTIDRVKIGDFTGTHPDTSIDSTLTYMNDPNCNGPLISYTSELLYGSTPGAWATRGTITWSITNGALQIYSQSSPPAADTWCTFKNASSLDNKTVLIEFNLTVVSNEDAVFTPYVRVDFFDGDVNGNNGADLRRFSQYYQYANPKTYHISKFVTFGTGAYKGLRLYSTSGPSFKIVRLDNFTIKEYPDVYTYINGNGLEIYKSPAEHFSFMNGNFNVALEELYINGLLNLNRGFMIGDF